MSTVKEIQLHNSSGDTLSSRDIGSEAQYVDVSYDSNNNIIEDITDPEVTVDHTGPLSSEIKKLNNVVQGATSSVAGVKGLVPAPAAGDTDKVLKSDGTWGTIVALPAGGTAAQVLEKQSSTDGDAAWAPVATQMTWEQYTALPQAQQMDGRVRIITNRGTIEVAQPMTWAQYLALSTAEKQDGTFRVITDRNMGPLLAEEQTAVDTEGIVTTAGAYTNTQALLDGIADEVVDLSELTNYTLTGIDGANCAALWVRKEKSKLVHINGYVTLGADLPAYGNANLASMPNELLPQNGNETFSTAYCYDSMVTGLAWITSGKLQFYKSSAALGAGSVIVINMTYKAAI